MNEDRQTTSRSLTANVKEGGCAAKMSSAELKQILASLSTLTSPDLLTGFDHFEDAAVYKVADDLAVIQTVDFFPPLLDDPYLYGQIAAVNALSDIYAMGGKPILALNILCFPTCDFPIEVVRDIVRGGASQVKKAGAILAGGHSIQSSQPIYGLAVTGLIEPTKTLTNGGGEVNDHLVLCKPIGTGVALLGMKAGLLSKSAESSLLDSLLMLNAQPLELARRHILHAATDVTGFGLIGHLHEMGKASNLAIELWTEQIPMLPECKNLAEQGFVPAGAYANRNSFEQFAEHINDVDLCIADLLFDPQTSGGLLFALAEDAAMTLVSDCHEAGIKASTIGKFKKGQAGQVEVRCR